MVTVRVYLKAGQYFDLTAESVSCRHNNLTGDLIGFSYTCAMTGIPLYLSMSEVAAVVQLGEEVKTDEQ